jgi:hypothetical protein
MTQHIWKVNPIDCQAAWPANDNNPETRILDKFPTIVMIAVFAFMAMEVIWVGLLMVGVL